MNILIQPRVQVHPETVVNPVLLNAGFNPVAELRGGVEARDLADGCVTAAKLNARLISSLPDELPAATHRLVHQTSGTTARMTVADLPAALPWYFFGEAGFDQAVEVTTTRGTDQLALQTANGVRRLQLAALTLGEVTTPGVYRAGRVTVDAKGRVLAVSAAAHWTSGWRSIPLAGSTFAYDHDLGRVPARVHVWLRCIGASGNAGYAYNDILEASIWFVIGSYLEALAVRVDDRQVRVSSVATDSNTRMARPDGDTPSSPTRAKWQMQIFARL